MATERNEATGPRASVDRSRAGRDIIVNLYGAVPTPLRSYVRNDQFLSLIDEQTRDFIDRPAVAAEINRHLNDASFPSGYITVQGEPGIGKTALAAHLIVANGWLHHFNIRAANISSPDAFLGNLCAQLITRYELGIDQIGSQELLDAGLLMKLLNLAAQRASGPLVIIIDALNEADPSTTGANRLLMPRTVPDGIFFLVTSRFAHEPILDVERRRQVLIAAGASENLDCLRQFAQRYAEQHAPAIAAIARSRGITAEELVERQLSQSDGNFRHLRLTLDYLFADNNGSESGLTAFPPALTGYYNQYWAAMRSPSDSTYRKEQYPVLSRLTASRRPMSVGEIAQSSGLDRLRVLEVLRGWLPYLHIRRDTDGRKSYSLFHDGFADYLGQDEEFSIAADQSAERSCVAGVPSPTGDELSLSPNVRDEYRERLRACLGGSGIPVSWTMDEISDLLRRAEANAVGPSEAVDLLTALHDALAAKRVLRAIDAGRLELAQLQVAYHREIRAWPSGRSADSLLVEAASVGVAERRRPDGPFPGALARYVIGVAATLRIARPERGDPLAEWTESLGIQLADTLRHFDSRRTEPAWLVIDLGDEPRGDIRWPAEVTWTRITADDQQSMSVPCDQTAEGLRAALTGILRAVPGRPLLVDLLMPRALMDEGIEYWPVLEVDGELEPLRAESRPRLRWSKRWRDQTLHARLVDRTDRAGWDGDVRHWLRDADPGHAIFLGGREPREAGANDRLRRLLRDGHGFVIWFSSGMPGDAVSAITDAIHDMPRETRRVSVPDHLPRFAGNDPAVIWDDPRGRGQFALPPPVALQSP